MEVSLELRNIGTLITEGINKWIEAGDILCRYLDNGGSLSEAAEQSGLTEDVLVRFEQIGRKQVHPKLLASPSIGMRSLSTCSYSVQEKYIDEPVRVMTDSGALLVEVGNLTSYQCRQVFKGGHVRNEAEQKAWIESERAKKSTKDEISHLPYRINGKEIVFTRNTVVTRRELQRILEGM